MLSNNSYKPVTNTAWVRARLCKLQKGCTRLAAASDKAYQLLAHGRWFSPGTPVSATTKTSRQDIAEILLKVAINTINQIKSNVILQYVEISCDFRRLSYKDKIALKQLEWHILKNFMIAILVVSKLSKKI